VAVGGSVARRGGGGAGRAPLERGGELHARSGAALERLDWDEPAWTGGWASAAAVRPADLPRAWGGGSLESGGELLGRGGATLGRLDRGEPAWSGGWASAAAVRSADRPRARGESIGSAVGAGWAAGLVIGTSERSLSRNERSRIRPEIDEVAEAL